MSAIYTKDQIDSVCDLREQGLSYQQIALRTGMKESSVTQYCMMLGAVSPSNRRSGGGCPKGKRPFTAEEDAVIREMSSSGAGVTAIAKRLGRAGGSVWNRINALAYREAKAESAA